MDYSKLEAIREKTIQNKQEFLSYFVNTNNRYIWGKGQLGEFVYKVLLEHGIQISGFIDSYGSEGCYRPDVLNKNDAVIIASVKYPEIRETLDKNEIKCYSYYDELALVVGWPIY